MPRTTIDPIDRLIGANIQFHRVRVRMPPSDLAERVGVSLDEIRKYERAESQVPASRLFHIGQALGVPVACFFVGSETNR
jgi:transcriptional regulator with XRE-family HTH domain